MNNKAIGRLLIVTGALLLAAAMSLVVFNKLQDSSAKAAAEKSLETIKQYITVNEDKDKGIGRQDAVTEEGSGGETAPGGITSADPALEEQEDTDGPQALEIDGEFYIGMLTIPKLGLELPVTRDYSEQNMAVAPSRWKGTLSGRDMIICGHNYSGFFLDLDRLGAGDQLIFTNLRGRQFFFTVAWTEIISGWDSTAMLSGSDSWDLTVFTCTWSGWSRVTVRAAREA